MVTRRRTLTLSCALGLLLPAVSGAQATSSVDPANLALARRLLQAMHYGDNVMTGVQGMMSVQRQRNPQLAPVFYDSALARMKRDVPEVLDSLAPIYARGLTGPELQAALTFFESPPGQSFAQRQPTLNSEAMGFGQRWGMRIGAAVAKDLVDAGISLTPP
jgi:hypothetical protein